MYEQGEKKKISHIHLILSHHTRGTPIIKTFNQTFSHTLSVIAHQTGSKINKSCIGYLLRRNYYSGPKKNTFLRRSTARAKRRLNGSLWTTTHYGNGLPSVRLMTYNNVSPPNSEHHEATTTTTSPLFLQVNEQDPKITDHDPAQSVTELVQTRLQSDK